MRLVVMAVFLLAACSALGIGAATPAAERSPVGQAPSPSASLPLPPSGTEASAAPEVTAPASATASGCEASLIQIDETPAASGDVFGFPLPKVIRKAGTVVTQQDAKAAFPALIEPNYVPSDLVLQLVLLPPSDSTSTYVQELYSTSPIDDDETDVEFFEDRGMIATQSTAHGNTASKVKSGIGDRAYLLRVGDNDAALVHGDPLSNGVRRYNLYWSDGTRDFHIAASTTPDELINVARSMYCGSATDH